jgi:hypothetical protein
MYQQFNHAIIEPLTTKSSSFFNGSINSMAQRMFPVRRGGGIKVRNTKGRRTRQWVKSINNQRVAHITRKVYRKYKPRRKIKF